ncbi:hypothetical protein [Aeromicrobium sp. Leaf350]|uniref:hypothetical protein n=1 Tax=Aeromicrobium sp. Leaf350 TaxID=2876565 RepID=UPI001E563A05|nr:hypothetical protein [Aeromicrobium sp. Leaf350]
MSVLGLTKMTWDLEHLDGHVDELLGDPRTFMSRYDVSDTEARAVEQLDATALLELGMNPVALRNLLVLLGIPHGQMYTHSTSLLDRADS